MTEPAYAERQTTSAIDKYAFQLSGWLKAEIGKNRKHRRSLKQLHLDLKELGLEGSYDRVAAFAKQWKVDQTDRVNSASKRTRGMNTADRDSKVYDYLAMTCKNDQNIQAKPFIEMEDYSGPAPHFELNDYIILKGYISTFRIMRESSTSRKT